MKVHLIRKETIEDFVKHNAQSRSSFTEWLIKVKYGDLNSPADILATFPSADLLGGGSNRVVFDIHGNKYRMIAKYAFGDNRCIYSFAGLGHMLSTTSYAQMKNSTPKATIKKELFMAGLKYKVITSKAQYREYCNVLEQLLFSGNKDRNTKDEIVLLTLLIEKWDEVHNSFDEIDPIQLVQSLMKEHDLKAKDLVPILNISKGYISDMLNYKKGLSKEVIRKLAAYFKISQEALNRPYQLTVASDANLKNAGVMNTKKKLAVA